MPVNAGIHPAKAALDYSFNRNDDRVIAQFIGWSCL
jgi:hypothetical protein